MSAISQIFVLLCGFLALMPGGRGSSDTDDKEWWETTLVYQILPRAFQDSNGDGVGDLRGISDRLDYIVNIGVETIRLSPFYTSPLLDSGYDISNHTEIHPLFGDLDDFDELISEAHERGLKVILDIVPNHSSDQHDWFISSVTDEEPYSDYYIWSDGGGANSPPNDWKNVYNDSNGSAWTWHEVRGQWYYHKFHSSEPDFDLSNENVVKEFLNIIDFWLERDVDGFCICDVSYFFENDETDNEFSFSNGYDSDMEDESHSIEKFNHNENLTNAALLYKFREHINDWVKCYNATPKYLIAEVDANDNNLISYYGNRTHDGVPPVNWIFITKINGTSDAEDVKAVIEDWIECVPRNILTNWLLSNKDTARAPTRMGLKMFDRLRIITLLLPGQAHTYYGDEIAMTTSEITHDELSNENNNSNIDLEESESSYPVFPRDVVNTAMQWNSSTSAGFSSNESTFVPVNPNYIHNNVDEQLQETNSFIQVFMKLASLRKESIFTHGDYELDTLNEGNVLVLRRTFENDTCVAVINFAKLTEKINLTSLYPDLQDTLKVAIISSNSRIRSNILTSPTYMKMRVSPDVFFLNANEAVVLCSNDVNVTKPYPSATDIETTDDANETLNTTEDGSYVSTDEDIKSVTESTTTSTTDFTSTTASHNATSSSKQPTPSTTETPPSAGSSLSATHMFLFLVWGYIIL